MLGGLQVLVHPRLLLRPAMVVVVAGDVTLDLWVPLLEAQGTDPHPVAQHLDFGDMRALGVKAAALSGQRGGGRSGFPMQPANYQGGH